MIETTAAPYTITRPTRQALDDIPADLSRAHQWVAWKSVWNPERNKYDKLPISPETGRMASSTNSATWGSLRDAYKRAEVDDLAGVGFVLSGDDDFAGVDLDHVRDRETGEIAPWALEMARRISSYTEVSPSGTGLRVFVRAKLPAGRRKAGDIEMYDAGRFLTVTGDYLPETPPFVEKRQQAIEELHAQVFKTGALVAPEPEPAPAPDPHRGIRITRSEMDELSDAQLIERARTAKNGAKFSRLWEGELNGYNSHSEADLALCSHLAFWADRDSVRVDALFRQSGLYRPKWDEMRGELTYGERTVAKSLERLANSDDLLDEVGEPDPVEPDKAAPPPAEDAPKTRPAKWMTTAEYIALFESWGYALAINDADDRILCNEKPLTDTTEAVMLSAVRDYGIQRKRGINVAHAREALQVIANRNRFHPVKRYLESLTWDGLDHIAHLSKHVTEKEPGTFRRWFEHWLVGAVARVYEPWQTPVLVLEGGQELGKSYLANWLCPDDSMFYAGSVAPDDRDCRIRRMSVWIWEIEELGATTRRQDQEALKAFITSTMIQDRRPYGHYDVLKPALTSFIGTLNNDAGFLMDRTGNRRFLVAPLEKIDWAYSRDVDKDGLWAQALETYRSGNDWKLTDEDRKERDAQNDNYMVDDPVEVRLEALYKATGKPTDFIATDTIMASLHSDGFGYSRGLTMSVASVLKSWGCEAARVRVDGEKARGYRGISMR